MIFMERMNMLISKTIKRSLVFGTFFFLSYGKTTKLLWIYLINVCANLGFFQRAK